MKISQKMKFILNFANKVQPLENNINPYANKSFLFAKLSCILLILSTYLAAQEFNMNSMPPPEMHMEYTAGALKDGGALKVTITVPGKWHVNANKVTDEFLKPSSIEAKAAGITFGEVKWPEPIKEFNEALELEILTFRGTFTVEIPVKKAVGNYDSLGTEVTFSYQACDNSICLAPTSKTIKLDERLGSAENGNAPEKKKFAIEGLDQLDDGNAQSEKATAAGDAVPAQKTGAENGAATENPADIAAKGNGAEASANNSAEAAGGNAAESANEKVTESATAVGAGPAANASENQNAEVPENRAVETSKNREVSASENLASVAPENRDVNVRENRASAVPENRAGIVALLFFAFLGGLILNLMPCVLPVLSLKLFSLIKQAGESRGRLLALGGATTAGIVASFWALAAVVTAVKAYGGSAGWGMQFQSAGFIAFMVVILTAFAMSFFGVFEIWLPGTATTKMDAASHKSGLAGAFFTGALLVLLSTPCSAPFLGTAMGFAFSQSAPVLFLFFTAAAMGLALPYLLVSAFPKVLKKLPKPGVWMVHLQKVMGVLLLATVAWLLWVVNEQAGLYGVGIFAVIAVASIACSVLLGKFAPPGAAFVREVGGIALCTMALVSLWFAALAPEYDKAATETFNARLQEQVTEDGWFRYSPELIKEMAQAKRTVFIDVTADWCLTCKANEAAVLSGDEFRQAMEKLNVALVKADWTRETPEVNALLKSMRKSGVPAYAIYPEGNAAKQIVLPELLTTAAIVEKIVGSRK